MGAPGSRMAAAAMARAIAAAGTDQMRSRAAALGEKMRAEDGLASAVSRVETLVAAGVRNSVAV